MSTVETRILPDLLTTWVRQRPDEIAVTFGTRQWTWRGWGGDIARAAAALSADGTTRGGRVGVLDKNHPASLQVLFAAGQLGAAVGMLNWRLAGDELVHVINDSGAEILFVGAEFAAAVAAIRDELPGVRRVVLIDGAGPDGYESFIASGVGAPTEALVEPDDLLMLMYSSGTTGRPKGVMLSHRAVLAHTRNVGEAFPFRSGDKNLVAMPLFHVGGTSYALFGLAAGVETLMTRDPDAASLVAALHAGATHTFFVPPVISGFLTAGGAAEEAMSGLRYLGYGAAPMPLPLLERALSTWPEINFVQVYGQTELSGVATVLSPQDHRNPDHPEWLVSAGTPVPACEVRVVKVGSHPHQDAGEGEQGELWIRTEQRMTGYLNQPAATAATITPDGWVRSGDVGRVDASGHLYVEDRLKDMIITGGENVYGPEVERVLLEHPGVADAAVIGVPDDHWGESVLGIVVADQPMNEDDVIAFSRGRLAGYKCPRRVEFVDALPRNASGKILKRELRAPYWSGRDRQV
jgi:acyl-CoA synthetase (AMP-forming)/AMP-acid ligase II